MMSRLSQSLEKSWYQKDGWSKSLMPLSGLFWLISTWRRKSYLKGRDEQKHGFKQKSVGAPVVVVGNITVGGNGKTPLVIYLSHFLKQQGYRPGVISRGYGGKADAYPMLVEKDTDPKHSGDEPLFVRQRVNCPVMVDPDRVRGAKALVEEHGCNVIICDDGLQHYRLHRDIEIAVVDGQRRQGNELLLPAGPLREGSWRLDEVDFVVLNGGQLRKNEYLMSLEPARLVNVKYRNQTQSLSNLSCSVSAIAGIGNPQRYFDLLQSKGVKLTNAIPFADHHQFQASDFPEGTVLMTEKDAVKCGAFAKDSWWYLPVSATLSGEFDQDFLRKLKSIKMPMKAPK